MIGVKRLGYGRELRVWVRKIRPGAILLTLEGEAEDKVLELSEDEIVSTSGVQNILSQLDKIYRKNSTVENFEALDSFETYRRPHDLSMNVFGLEKSCFSET